MLSPILTILKIHSVQAVKLMKSEAAPTGNALLKQERFSMPPLHKFLKIKKRAKRFMLLPHAMTIRATLADLQVIKQFPLKECQEKSFAIIIGISVSETQYQSAEACFPMLHGFQTK